MVVKWTFLDTVTQESYTLEINPSTPASPDWSKNIVFQGNIGPNDTNVVQVSDKVQELDFSGTILTQDQYEAFETSWAKDVPVAITDDLGYTYTVFFKDFIPKRERSPEVPWRHSFDVKAIVASRAGGGGQQPSTATATFTDTTGARS